MTPEEITAASLQERLALAQSPATVDEILLLLAQDKKLDVRRTLTERKGLSEQLMQLLVDDKSKDIRLRMANHPELKVEFQEILAGSREVAIRVALTGRNDVSDDLLMKLAAGSNRDVGLTILNRAKLSDELILALASNNNRDVGLAIVKRSTLSDELQEQLITHRNIDVRVALARRDDVSEDLLLKMASSDTWDVGMALLERKSLSGKLLNQLAHHKDKYVRMVLARRDDLPEAILTVLFEDKSPAVVAAIAQRRNLSADQIEKLTNHKSKYVRADIAAREDLSHHLIEKLSADKHVEVLHAIANRGNLSEQFIKQMLSNCSAKRRVGLAMKEPLQSNVIHELALDEDEQVRAAVAARSDISESMIDTFVTDSSACVRLAVACRSDTPEQLSQQLFRQLSIDDLYLCEVSELLLYIKKVSKAHLEVSGRKLIFSDYSDVIYPNDIEYERLGQLLPLLFSHPAFRKIQELVINIDSIDYIDWGWSFDKTLVALSAVNTPTEIKRIYLVSLDIDLSSASCSSLNVINNRVFPRLEYLSTECFLGEFQLDLLELKEISMMSSHNEFHELLLMVKKSNLPNLETLSISAGCYGRDGTQKQIMKLPLDDAHEIWPKLKSLTIGARYAYDWSQVFTAPLFTQLDNLMIELDESKNIEFIEYVEGIDDCETMMCKNVDDLIDALIDRAEYLPNIQSITVSTGFDFKYGDGDRNLLIEKNKIERLKQLYNFNINDLAYVGGFE